MHTRHNLITPIPNDVVFVSHVRNDVVLFPFQNSHLRQSSKIDKSIIPVASGVRLIFNFEYFNQHSDGITETAHFHLGSFFTPNADAFSPTALQPTSNSPAHTHSYSGSTSPNCAFPLREIHWFTQQSLI